RRWNDGLALGIVAVGLLALGSRLFPAVLQGDEGLREYLPSLTRLSYPLGYWNGLGIFVALAFPLLLAAASLDRRPLLRGLAVAPAPHQPPPCHPERRACRRSRVRRGDRDPRCAAGARRWPRPVRRRVGRGSQRGSVDRPRLPRGRRALRPRLPFAARTPA